MSDAVVVAWDPGAVTAVAAWGHAGLLFSFQDEERHALRTGITFMHTHRERIVGWTVEALFVGVNARSSLSVAESAGRICGAAWAAGIALVPWRPLSSEWRRDAGLPVGKRGTREVAEKEARDRASLLLDRTLPRSQTHLAEAIVMAETTWRRHWSRETMRRGASA